MFHLGSFESSLRNSDGGKKYSMKKRKETKTKYYECKGPNKRCEETDKSNKKDSNKKKKVRSESVLKSDESLTDSAVEISDHVPRESSRETSVDDGSTGLSESDNEKLRILDCDNYDSTRKKRRNGDNKLITSFENVLQKRVKLVRSRSWNGISTNDMKTRKTLKIRGPLGSLVDLSKSTTLDGRGSSPSDSLLDLKSNEKSNCPIVKVVVKELSDASEVFKRKKTQDEGKTDEKLFDAIDALSKRMCDTVHTRRDAFENLQLEEFENEEVSKLFEKYFENVKDGETIDSREAIEDLIESLNCLDSRKIPTTMKNRKGSKISIKDKKKNCTDAEVISRLCRSHLKDEEIIKNILPNKKEMIMIKKSKKTAELERKWIPGGISKRLPVSETMETIKSGSKSLTNQNPANVFSKPETHKFPADGTPSGKLSEPDKRAKCSQEKTEVKKKEFVEHDAKSWKDKGSEMKIVDSNEKVDVPEKSNDQNNKKSSSKVDNLKTTNKLKEKLNGFSSENDFVGKNKTSNCGNKNGGGRSPNNRTILKGLKPSSGKEKIHLRIEENFTNGLKECVEFSKHPGGGKPETDDESKTNGKMGKVKKLISNFESSIRFDDLQPETNKNKNLKSDDSNNNNNNNKVRNVERERGRYFSRFSLLPKV